MNLYHREMAVMDDVTGTAGCQRAVKCDGSAVTAPRLQAAQIKSNKATQDDLELLPGWFSGTADTKSQITAGGSERAPVQGADNQGRCCAVPPRPRRRSG